MIKLKETGEKVVIVQVVYADVKVLVNNKELPAVTQYKVADLKGKWTDYVSPDQLVMVESE